VRGKSDTRVVFSEELRVHLRSRWYLFFTVTVVLVLVIAMVVVPLLQDGGEASGTAPASGKDLQRIGFVDRSGQFPALGGQNGPLRYDSQAEGLAAVARGEIDSLYVIGEDYLQSGKVEQYAEFEGRFPSNPSGEAAFRTLLVRGLITGRVDPAVTTRVLAPAAFENFRVQPDGTVAELTPTAVAVGGLLVPMLFAALLGMGLVMGFSYMVQSVSEEKESRLVEVVITSASPLSIMGGKLLALGTVGLAQAAVWIIAAAVTVPVMLGHISGAGEFAISAGLWATIIACFITGYFLTTTLAIFVGAVAPSSREAGRLGGWIPVLAFVPFWFSGLLLTQPNGLAARLLSYVPFVAPTGLLMRISAGGDMAPWQIAAALVGVAATSVVVLWVSTRVFRAAILMRGQNFTRHNLWVALRDAH
jgi:ABC-2 type transport system permease protein